MVTPITARNCSHADAMDGRHEQPWPAKKRSFRLEVHAISSLLSETVITIRSRYPLLSRDPWPPSRATKLTAPLGARSHTRLRKAEYVMFRCFRWSNSKPARD